MLRTECRGWLCLSLSAMLALLPPSLVAQEAVTRTERVTRPSTPVTPATLPPGSVTPAAMRIAARPELGQVPDGVLKSTIAEAKQHFQEFKTKRSGTYRRAQAALLARGWKPTEIARTQRVGRERRGRGAVRVVAAGLQQYQESSSDGEFTAWSWDDADPNTWEGVISLYSYQTGESMDIYTQIYIGEDGPEESWWEEIGYYDGGWTYTDALNNDGARRLPGMKSSGPRVFLAQQSNARRQACLRQCLKLLLNNSIRDAAAWCLATGFACRGAGPWYLYCLGGGCSGFAIIYLGHFYVTSEQECADRCGV